MTQTAEYGRTSRRPRWRVVAWFALGLVALDLLVGAFGPTWRAYDPVYYRDRLDACRRERWDVVIAGGSPTMCGFDADRLGVRAFNLGLPLATTAEVCHAVERGCGERPPGLLVYGITATDLNGNRIEEQGPKYLMGPSDLAGWAGLRPGKGWWGVRAWARERAGRLWQLKQHGGGIRLWAADHLDATFPGVCPEEAALAKVMVTRSEGLASPRGMLPYPPAAPEMRLDRQKAAGTVPPFPFLANYDARGHLPYLHRLLDGAAARGVPVVLVDLPVPADLDDQYRAEFAAYREVLAGVERDRGVPVLRATRDAVGITDADFSDLIHLNADGAAKLSDWLAARLPGARGGKP